jgi:CheY-like chemotaxis protein
MSKHILLIEDDATVRENTAELLELSGYQISTAANGKIGIEKATALLPDIIICDVMMPEMDGYDVLSNLSNNASTLHIPFIFLSAKTDHKDIRKGMDLGADDYLTKPFEEEDLVSAIESRLAKTAIINQRKKASQQNEVKPSLNLDGFREMLRKFDTLQIKANQSVYEPGDTANRFFLVDRGVIKLHQVDDNGKELITALHKADDFFGSLVFNRPVNYKEYATALEDTVLHIIPKNELKNILQNNHQVLFDIIDILGESLDETKEQLLDMAYSSVQRKTAQTILLFTERLKKNKLRQIRISRADLAAVAGIASESLIRTLSKFKKEGIIEIEGRNIKVMDFDALEQIQ